MVQNNQSSAKTELLLIIILNFGVKISWMFSYDVFLLTVLIVKLLPTAKAELYTRDTFRAVLSYHRGTKQPAHNQHSFTSPGNKYWGWAIFT